MFLAEAIYEYVTNTKMLSGWSEDKRLTYFTLCENNLASRFDLTASNNVVHIICEEYWEVEPPWSKTELRYIRSVNSGVSWIGPINFTITDDCYSMFPSITAKNSNIYVVWQDYRGAAWEIYFKNSSDNGQTWSSDTALTSNDGKASQWPQIAVSGNYIHVVWSDMRCSEAPNLYNEVFYKRGLVQANGSIVWDDGLGNVNEDRRLTFHTPDNDCCIEGIVVVGDDIHIIFDRYVGYWQVCYLKSEDNGANWSDIKILNDVPHSYGYDIVANTTGVYVVFIETKLYAGGESAARLFYIFSSNLGNAWEPKQQLTYNLQPINVYYPGIVMDPEDNNQLYITYNLLDDPNYGGSGKWLGCYYMESLNGGISWGDPIKLTGNDTWNLYFALADSYIHAVYVNDTASNSEIYYKRSPPFGTEPANITITANPSTLIADGVSNSTLTILVYNETGTPLPSQTISLSINGFGSVSNVIDNGDGSYTANYTAGTVAGNVIITATAGFVSNNTTIVLKPGAIARIEIDPSGPKWYNKGENCTYTAVGYDAFNNVNTSWQPYWYVDENVGIINETGFFTATKKGIGAVNCTDNVTSIYNISIVVVNNSKPAIDAWAPTEKNQYINETENITFAVNASDLDRDNIFYFWYLNDALVVGETNNSFTFYTNYSSAGNHTIKVIVSDDELSAEHTWNLTVLNVNRQPSLNSYSPLTNQTILETQTQTFSVNASDPDNDNLTYSWYLDSNLLINETNSTYTFIPDKNASSNYSVKVLISDGDLSVNHTWIVTVINVRQIQQTINELQNQLNQAIENYTALQLIITQLNDNLSSLWNQLNESLGNNTELKNIITSISQNLTIIWNELNQSLSSNTALQTYINQLNDTLNLSSAQISALWSQVNQSLINETFLQTQISSLNENITKLQEDIAQVKREKVQRESEKEQTTSEFLVIIGILLAVVVCAWVYAGLVRRKKQ